MRALDFFCGIGGFSLGAHQANVPVLAGIDNDPQANRLHHRNHPGVKLLCSDINLVDWNELPRAELLLASSCCQGHTKAKGTDKEWSEASRNTANAVLSYIEWRASVGDPLKGFAFENVPEFAEWADRTGWFLRLQEHFEWTSATVDAAQFGVPQNRVRFIVVGHRHKKPKLSYPDHPAATIATALLTHDDPRARWTPIHKPGRSEATLNRIARGRAECGDFFVMPYYSGGSGLTGRSVDRPIGTIRTHGCWAVVDCAAGRMRMLAVDELKAAMGFPQSYDLSGAAIHAIKGLGNAIVPAVARWAIEAVIRADRVGT